MAASSSLKVRHLAVVSLVAAAVAAPQTPRQSRNPLHFLLRKFEEMCLTWLRDGKGVGGAMTWIAVVV